MQIPYKELSSAALQAIIEEYITREGTDYGVEEFSLKEKLEQVKSQLQRGDITIDYDADSQTCQLWPETPK